MDEAIVKLNIEGYDYYIYLQFSDEPADCEDCDSCIDYSLFDENRNLIDGGLMEYDSKDRNYESITDAIDDIVDFACDKRASYILTDLTLEDGFEQ